MLLAMMLGLAGVQDVPAAQVQTKADGTQRWSILADPCAGKPAAADEILVCGEGEASQRLPLADSAPPDRPMPGNPDRSGIGALALTDAPCATRSEGCTTGIDLFGGGTFLIRAVGKLIDPDSCCEEPGESRNFFKLAGDVGSAVGKAFKKKPDKSNRIPIALDDPAPASAEKAAP